MIPIWFLTHIVQHKMLGNTALYVMSALEIAVCITMVPIMVLAACARFCAWSRVDDLLRVFKRGWD